MATPPDAFLSYTHFDDQYHGGAISEFRDRLSDAVRAMTARPFDIFQDIDGIGLGQNWRKRLNIALGEARFFIPILTPSYFGSQACREELETFLAFERESGRDDLILPIYWIRCPILENRELRAQDPLAELINDRQRRDWRRLRHRPYSDPEVREALEGLAEQIDEARIRVMPARNLARVAPAGRLESAPVVRPRPEPKPGDIFCDIDAPWCPELVVIPAGSSVVGSPEDERRWAGEQGADRRWVQHEMPQHGVKIAMPFAVGRYPVTFEEYDHFADATGREKPSDEGWGRGRRPVINVSWDDAKAYVAWLSMETGQPCRLLSEAEWEYVARAGTTTRHCWGDDITPENANYGDSEIGRTTEVGCYPPTPWGLYDINGNVWEWNEDCWSNSYEGAPSDGSAWTSGNCALRVLRGGSWKSNRGILRAAYPNRDRTRHRENNIGFRVARTLAAQSASRLANDTHWTELQYHQPALAGQVTFNYSNNNGRFAIGRDEFFFQTKWSKASDRSIHLVLDPASISGVAEAPQLRSYRDVGDPSSYDMSSRVRTIEEGEYAILKNIHSNFAVLKILDVKDRTRSDSVDELTFEFWILPDRT